VGDGEGLTRLWPWPVGAAPGRGHVRLQPAAAELRQHATSTPGTTMMQPAAHGFRLGLTRAVQGAEGGVAVRYREEGQRCCSAEAARSREKGRQRRQRVSERPREDVSERGGRPKEGLDFFNTVQRRVGARCRTAGVVEGHVASSLCTRSTTTRLRSSFRNWKPPKTTANI
jgi:hypothetical protein